MTSTPAIEWLQAMFEFDRGNPGLLPSPTGPMIQLKSDMDAGQAMRVRPEDYHDPQRRWL
jgi:hypothetical protein